MAGRTHGNSAAMNTLLRRIRDAEQQAEYHFAEALEWTWRARQGREELQRVLGDLHKPGAPAEDLH